MRLLRLILHSLQQDRYIHAYPVPRVGENGRAPYMYMLANRGRRYVAALGVEVPRRHRPSEPAQYGYQAIQHSLAVSDFIVLAEMLARSHRAVDLPRFLHERALARLLRRSPAVPDAWLDVRVHARNGTYRTCFALELDRGFHRQAAWRRKISALLTWAASDGPYQQQFGTTSLTILVVATRAGWSALEGARRRDQLLAWTQALLSDEGANHQTDLFRFAALEPDRALPREVFFGRLWYRPDSNRRALSLLDEVAPAAA